MSGPYSSAFIRMRGAATSTLATALIWLVVSRPLDVAAYALRDGVFVGLLNALANLVR